jgi:catechol 2,3-dioxygenase-like lactoylglutathione lyase family enzyme
MKPNSISGFTCYVEDLARTAEFYEALGFRAGKQEPDRLTFYVNWFFVTFISQDREQDPESKREAELPNKGSGLYIHVKVDDLDAYHDAVVSKGLEPASEPQVRHGGGREFVLRDPDGYKLVLFEKK